MLHNQRILYQIVFYYYLQVTFIITLLIQPINSYTSCSFLLHHHHHHHYHSCKKTKTNKAYFSLSAHRPPLPDLLHTGSLSDQEFHDWLTHELEHVPNRMKYDKMFDISINAIVNWRKRYRGNPKLWKRIFKKDRVIKELIEAVPVMEAVHTYVNNFDTKDNDKYRHRHDGKKITIMDLCSGKGYLSMLLSEILPPDKVNKIILIDKAWAMCNTELKSHHINWDHIYGKTVNIEDKDQIIDSVGHETYFTTWPIPLHTSKQDLKQSCNQRQMKKHFFDAIDGPVVILAIHLCGTLSLKAIDMFNNNSNVSLFALKPCCLPQMIYAQRGDIFKIGKHEFDAEEVCSNGTFNKKTWNGPPRWHLESKFDRWAENLHQGIDIVENEEGRKEKRDIVVQVEGGFQNTYIFAQRSPLTKEIWKQTLLS